MILMKKKYFYLLTLFSKKNIKIMLNLKRIFEDFDVLYEWQENNFTGPAPSAIKKKMLKKYNLHNSIWIETGTWHGETTIYLSQFCKKVYTLEPSKINFDFASKKFVNIENIEIINKSSEDGLEDVLKNINNETNICFFLDGHFSGSETYKGSNNTPIAIELKLIEKYLYKFNKITVLIDDMRCFNGTNGYPTKDIFTKFSKMNQLNFDIENDIGIIKKI